MSEPQHPTPFGAHKAGQSGSQAGALPGSQPENAASAANAAPGDIQAVNLDSVAAVGARLTQLREAKNWSLDDVSARLKVSPQKLRALESGDLSLFPDRNFAAGIVRSYAKIMGADPAPLTTALRHASGPVEQNLSLPASSGAGLPRGRVSVPLGSSPRRRSWLWGVAAVIVAVIALAMWHTGGDSAAWLARLKASANGATQATSGETSASSSVAATEETTANTGSVASGEAATEAPANAAGAQPMPSPLGTNALPASSSTITAVQGTAAHAQSASAPVSAPAASLTKPAPQADVVATASAAVSVGSGANELELKVASDSWFSVRQKDGKEVFSGLVKAGSVQ